MLIVVLIGCPACLFCLFFIENLSGCSGGIGRGNYFCGAGSGAGHGGAGGSGYFNGTLSRGGLIYGNADLPCELGSGTQGANLSYGSVFGGGMIGKLHYQE